MVVLLLFRGGDEQAVVLLEPVGSVSPDPFTPSIATVDLSAARQFSTGTGAGSGGAVTGNTSRLYGSAGSVCDGRALASSLGDDPALASAWAQAAGVPTGEVSTFIAALTPVLLGVDTAVTNHSYTGGEAVGFQSVLQSGTPVMVDHLGVPRVVCSCGNPLQPPQAAADATYEGERWDGFDPSDVVEVAPAPEPVEEFETVDVGTGEDTTTPVGAGALLDGLLVADGTGVHVLDSASGALTTVLDRPVAEVYDDGAGGLLFNLARSAPSARSWSLTADAPATAEEAAIWHLPAGADQPQQLVSSADPNAQWHVLLAAGTLDGRRYMAYSTLTWDQEMGGPEDPTATGPVLLRDLDSGQDVTIEESGFGWELHSGPFSFNADQVAYDQGYASGYFVVRGPDLQRRVNACAPADDASYDDEADCPYVDALDGNGRAVDVEEVSRSSASRPQVVVYDTASFDEVARWGAGDMVVPAGHTTVIDVVGTRAVLSTRDRIRPGRTAAVELNLDSGETTALEVGGLVRILRAPLRRPTGSTSEATTTTTVPAPNIDPMNMVLPGGVCDDYEGDETPGIPIADGSGSIGDPMDYESGYVYVELDADDSVMADLDGDGVQEVVVAPLCNWGGSGYTTPLAVLRPAADGSVSLVALHPEEFGRGSRAVDSLSVDGDVLIISGSEWIGDEALCCPESTFTQRWRFRGGTWSPA